MAELVNKLPGQAVVALRGQLDMAEAAGAAAAFTAVAARGPQIIVDLARLASWPRAAMRSGARALVRERHQLRKQAGAAEALPRARTVEPASIL